MKLNLPLTTDPYPCGYLSDQLATLEQTRAEELTAGEYRNLLDQRWRRFGRGLFRPVCPQCQKCMPIRILVDSFQPNRSQVRNARTNQGRLRLEIERVSRDRDQLQKAMTLHHLFHKMQTQTKHWRDHEIWESGHFVMDMADQPFPVEMWTYWLNEAPVGVGYVDPLPDGLSAIYFVHHPSVREWGPGIWNVLSLINEAKKRKQKYIFLGYWVPGSPSMGYKAAFQPSEILDPSGHWVPFPTHPPS